MYFESLRRFVGWLGRLLSAIESLGLVNAFKIFVLARFTEHDMFIKLSSGNIFRFRGRMDAGVVSHFYSEGYYICDSDSVRIRNIIDAGANIGDETARFLLHYPKSQIVAVEPDEANFEMLSRNFEMCSKSVFCINAGLWPVKANLRVVSRTSNESFQVEETSSSVDTIRSCTVQDILDLMGWDSIDILKLDIEGAEYDLFSRNCNDWIAKVKALIFELPDNDRPGATQVIFNALVDWKFSCYVCGENLVLIRSDLPWRLKRVQGFYR